VNGEQWDEGETRGGGGYDDVDAIVSGNEKQEY